MAILSVKERLFFIRRNANIVFLLLAIMFCPLISLASEVIDPWTGQLFLKETDLEVKVGPVLLKIKRSSFNKPGESGVFRTKWRSNWETEVIRLDSAIVIKEGANSYKFGATGTENKFVNSFGEVLEIDRQKRFVHYKANGNISIYDARGRLIEKSDKNKNKIRFSYTIRGRLKMIKAPRGHFLTITPDEMGRIGKIESSTGQVVEYIYTDFLLTRVMVNGKIKRDYVYDDQERIKTLVDPISGPVSFQYDKKGRVISRSWVDGAKEFYEFDDLSETVRYINTEGAITSFKRTNKGKKETIVGPGGEKTSIKYNDEFKPVQITYSDGTFSHYVYDSLGRLTETKSPTGRITTYEYVGNTSFYKSITQGKDNRIVYEYDVKNNLVLLQTNNKDILQFTYHPDGQIKTRKGLGFPAQEHNYYADGSLKNVTNALGQVTTYRYDKRGNLTQQIDPAGNVFKWKYDEQNRLVQETDAASASLKYAYNSEGNLLSITDSLGNVESYEYDKKGRLKIQTDPLGRKSSFQYNSLDQIIEATDPAGYKTTYQYDQSGRIIRHTNSMGANLKYQYNSTGSLSQVSDSSGRKWLYETSKDGLSTIATDPLGKQTNIRFDPQNRTEKTVNSSGETTSIQFDNAGNIIREDLPGHAALAYTHDENGYISAVEDEKGVGVRYEHDPLGRLLREKYPTGYFLEYRYDEAGNLSLIKDSSGHQTNMKYTPNGLLADMTDASGNTVVYEYDAAARITGMTDPLGHKKKFNYNAAGELVNVIGPGKDTAQVEYDEVGNVRKIFTPKGTKISFLRDGLGNAVEEIDPFGNAVKITYDKTGKIVRFQNRRGQTILFSYDHLGRLSKKRLSTGATTNYSYDNNGNLSKIDDANFPVLITYDNFNRITRREYPAIKRNLQYEYNKQGEIVKFTDSEGRFYEYTYDKFHRMSAINSSSKNIVAFNYFNNDLPKNIIFGNGIKKSWQYDLQGRTSHIEYIEKTGNPFYSQTISYDAGGNPIKLIDQSNKQINYKYNKAGQLIQEEGPDNLIRFQYKAYGNRALMENGNKKIQYTYNKADQLQKAGDEKFVYDADGNMVQRSSILGTFQYGYDIENRLTSVSLPDGKVVKFGYAPTGERIWRDDEKGRTWFVTDGLNLLAELDENFSPLKTYFHAGVDTPLVMWEQGKAFFYTTDHLGSVAALTDDSGKITGTYETDAFGNIKNRQTNIGNPFIFTARYYEKALGLYYYRARFYDPSIGRFLSTDPKIPSPQAPSSLNFYAYVKNSPVRYSDPFGLYVMNDYKKFTSADFMPPGLHHFRQKGSWALPVRSKGQRAYHMEVNINEVNKTVSRLNKPDRYVLSPLDEPNGEYLGPVARKRLSRPLYNTSTSHSKTQKIKIPGSFQRTRQPLRIANASHTETQDIKIPSRVQRTRRPIRATNTSNTKTQTVQIPNRSQPGAGTKRPSPGPLTTGQSSVSPPGFTNIQRPLTGRESAGLTVLGILSAAEAGNRIYHSEDPVKETKNFAIGLVKAGTAAAGATLLVGATPVTAIGLALSIASHGSDIAELPGKVAGYWQARSNENEAKQRHQELLNKLPEALQSVDNLEHSMVTEMEALVNKGKSVCKIVKTEAQKAVDDAEKAVTLLGGIQTDSPDILDAALGECEKISSINDELLLLKEKALLKGATQEEIKALVVQAKEKQARRNGYSNTAKKLNQNLKKAVSTKEQIIKTADAAAKAKANFESQMANFSKTNEQINEKTGKWQTHITKMRTSFKDAKSGPQKDQLMRRLSDVEALLKTYHIECEAKAEKASMDKAVEESLSAKFDAEKLVNADLEGYAGVLSDCADSKHPDYVKEMEVALNGAGNEKSPGDKEIDEDIESTDGGGFEDEEDKDVSDNESLPNDSDSGFSDESDVETEDSQIEEDDTPAETTGFSDESDDTASSTEKELVTYFDRNFMPQSWKTSGNSQQVRVHLFSLGSRLGFSAALARHAGPPSANLIIDHLNGASIHVKGAHDSSFLPMKAYKNWQQIQKKHQYWIGQLQRRPNIQGRERQLKTLSSSFRGHAMGLARKIAFQASGNGLEQRENCDSYYLRIGYYLAYASQALTYAAQGQSQGMPKIMVKRIIKNGRSAADSAAQYMRNLKKLKLATGYCIDLGNIADRVFQGSRGGKTLPVMAQKVKKGWQDTLEALGGLSSVISDSYIEKIGKHVFANMKKLLLPGAERIHQGMYDDVDNVFVFFAKDGYNYQYSKKFMSECGRFGNVNPGFSFILDHAQPKADQKKRKCVSNPPRISVLKTGQFKRRGGEVWFCLRKHVVSSFRDEASYSSVVWTSGNWSIKISGHDLPNHPDTMFGQGEKSIKYMYMVLDHLVPRLRQAIETDCTSGEMTSDTPLQNQNSPLKNSGANDNKGINFLNIEQN